MRAVLSFLGRKSLTPSYLASRACLSSSPAASIDPSEAQKFAALAQQWWATDGPFAPLHAFNIPRVRFIRDSVCSARGLPVTGPEPLSGLSVLDVGCGGGILSESLARLGAQVLGVDVAHETIAAASAHSQNDPLVSSRLSYKALPAEQLLEDGQNFDVVIASEVIEHVRSPQDFLNTLTALTKEDGQLVVSTLSRTLRSLSLAVVAAEYVVRMVPAGTHDWAKFITPEELAIMGRRSGLRMKYTSGMTYEKLSGKWGLSEDLGINYITLMQRGAEEAV